MIKINGITYDLTTKTVGNKLALTKNDVPVLEIPEPLITDFALLLSYAGAAAKFLKENPPPNDDDKKVTILTGTKTEL